MNQFEFILGIIVIVSIVSVIKMVVRNRLGLPQHDDRAGRRNRRDHALMTPQESPETSRLRDEVKLLKDRIQTLERIAVDKENSLAREIDSLRDR